MKTWCPHYKHKSRKIYFKHEPFQEINTISTQYFVFHVYLFEFRMKNVFNQFLTQTMKYNDVHKGFEYLYLTLLSDMCKIQDSVGSKKTSKNTKPTKLWAQDMPQASPGGAVLLDLWWPSSVGPEGTQRAIMICAGSRWNAVMIPEPFWIQGHVVVFLYQSSFSLLCENPNCEKTPLSVCIRYRFMSKGAVFSAQHEHWLKSSLKK